MVAERPSLHDTENAFQPAREISDIERFAGRAKPVGDAFLALLAEGANVAIVGNRGIGKTSLARQVQNFGRGNNELLSKLKLPYDHIFDFQVMYLACGNEVKGREDLLLRLLTSDACLGSWLYDVPKTKKMMQSLSPKLSAKILGIGGEINTKHSTEDMREMVTAPQTV